MVFDRFNGLIPGRNNVRSQWVALIISHIVISRVDGLRTGLGVVAYYLEAVDKVSGECGWRVSELCFPNCKFVLAHVE